ncbi:MAG TPA: hypothetical protein VMR80_10260 [Candidatus Acidoferrum sp.]|nr:hypothetical protein [Candidatus Acidoferrum sp.]
MLKRVLTVTGFAFLCVAISAQSTTRPKFLDRARIQRSGSGIMVTANDSIPLFQALYALRLEYGWQVDWESAPGYSHFDVVDDTDPKWRAAHVGEKGVTRPAGGLFTATLPEASDPSDPTVEREVLSGLIGEYNATDNPGKYALRAAEPDGRFAVVGVQVRGESGELQFASPLLDTPVTLTKTRRNVYDTVESIFTALQSATGKRVIFAAASSSLFRMTETTTGGEKVAARELLTQALASTKQPIQYDLFFNPDVPVYILNVSPAMREEDDGKDGRKLIPTDGHR